MPDFMTEPEVNTALAVIANWRGNPLDDGLRAAWRYQLRRLTADQFDQALTAWGQSERRALRPSIGDLMELVPAAGRILRQFTPLDSHLPAADWDLNRRCLEVIREGFRSKAKAAA